MEVWDSENSAFPQTLPLVGVSRWLWQMTMPRKYIVGILVRSRRLTCQRCCYLQLKNLPHLKKLPKLTDSLVVYKSLGSGYRVKRDKWWGHSNTKCLVSSVQAETVQLRHGERGKDWGKQNKLYSVELSGLLVWSDMHKREGSKSQSWGHHK